MKRIVIAAAFAVAASSMVAAQNPMRQPVDSGKKVTLTGCVVKGEGGYVLANVTATGGGAEGGSAATAAVASQPAIPRMAETGEASSAYTLYWLDRHDQIEEYVGKRVEVTGDILRDVQLGDVEVTREAGKARVEFESEGRQVVVNLREPAAAVGTSGATGTDNEKKYVVRKVEVEKVKPATGGCDM